MNIQIFGTSKCFDTKKAQRYFKERGIKFQMTGILAVAVPGELPPDTVPTAMEAAQACPVSAITISE